jgi:hypothetical protein
VLCQMCYCLNTSVGKLRSLQGWPAYLYVANVALPAAVSGGDLLRMATLPGRSSSVSGTVDWQHTTGQCGRKRRVKGTDITLKLSAGLLLHKNFVTRRSSICPQQVSHAPLAHRCTAYPRPLAFMPSYRHCRPYHQPAVPVQTGRLLPPHTAQSSHPVAAVSACAAHPPLPGMRPARQSGWMHTCNTGGFGAQPAPHISSQLLLRVLRRVSVCACMHVWVHLCARRRARALVRVRCFLCPPIDTYLSRSLATFARSSVSSAFSLAMRAFSAATRSCWGGARPMLPMGLSARCSAAAAIAMAPG